MRWQTLKALPKVSPDRLFLNAESVGQFQPRVCFETLGHRRRKEILRNPEGVAIWRTIRNPFRVATTSKSILNPRVAAKRGSPGLELANAFSVIQFLKSLSYADSISTFCAKLIPTVADLRVPV